MALAKADDADRVVDRIVLRPPPGAESERCDPNAHGAETADGARSRRRDLADDRSPREGGLVRLAALGRDPAIVRRERGAVCERSLCAAPAFCLVYAEVREREQPARRCQDE